MSAFGSKLRHWKGDGMEGYMFRCPGCKGSHTVNTNLGGWGFNGNGDAPTFVPSVLVRGNKLMRGENGKWTGEWERDQQGNLVPEICHSFVTDGQIQFLGDCTHTLVGQTVSLPDYDHSC